MPTFAEIVNKVQNEPKQTFNDILNRLSTEHDTPGPLPPIAQPAKTISDVPTGLPTQEAKTLIQPESPLSGIPTLSKSPNAQAVKEIGRKFGEIQLQPAAGLGHIPFLPNTVGELGRTLKKPLLPYNEIKPENLPGYGKHPTVYQYAAAGLNKIQQFGSGLSSPENVGLLYVLPNLPVALRKAVDGYFLSQMAPAAYEQARQGIEAARKEHGPEAFGDFVEAGLSGAMAGTMAKGLGDPLFDVKTQSPRNYERMRYAGPFADAEAPQSPPPPQAPIAQIAEGLRSVGEQVGNAVNGPDPTQTTGERIAGVAVMTPQGLKTAPLEAGHESLTGVKDSVQREADKNNGFVTEQGRFVTREEAAAIGLASGQLPKDFDGVPHSHDFLTKKPTKLQQLRQEMEQKLNPPTAKFAYWQEDGKGDSFPVWKLGESDASREQVEAAGMQPEEPTAKPKPAPAPVQENLATQVPEVNAPAILDKFAKAADGGAGELAGMRFALGANYTSEAILKTLGVPPEVGAIKGLVDAGIFVPTADGNYQFNPKTYAVEFEQAKIKPVLQQPAVPAERTEPAVSEAVPIKAYHFTTETFDKFDESKIGSSAGHDDPVRGFYLTNNPNYKGNIPEGQEGEFHRMDVEVSLKNPLRLKDYDATDNWGHTGKQAREAIESAGYDGVIYGDGDEIVAFHPDQIKRISSKTAAVPTQPDKTLAQLMTEQGVGEQIKGEAEPQPPVVTPQEAETAKPSEDISQPDTQPEVSEARQAAIKKGVHPVALQKLDTAVAAKNIVALRELLDPANKNLRSIFTAEQGVALPKTMKGTNEALLEWKEGKSVGSNTPPAPAPTPQETTPGYKFTSTRQAAAWAKQNGVSGKITKLDTELYHFQPDNAAGKTLQAPGGWYLDEQDKPVYAYQDQAAISEGLRGPYVWDYVQPETGGTEVGTIKAQFKSQDPQARQAAERYYNQKGLKFPNRIQTETPEFKQWFKDSKVVDSDGNPMMVYHGGAKVIEFNTRAGEKTVRHESAALGAFFSDNATTAKQYGDITAVYLKIVNPLQITERELASLNSIAAARLFRMQAKRDGYDGIKVRTSDTATFKGGTEYIAFDPTQIKLADLPPGVKAEGVTEPAPTEKPVVTGLEATSTPSVQSSISPLESGKRAFAEGRKRVVPTELLLKHGTKAAEEWYRGWDQANLAAPVPSSEVKSPLDNLSPEERAELESIEAAITKKLGQVGSGVDPEIATLAARMANLYAKGGVRSFQQFAESVKGRMPSLWDRIKAYLRGAWNTIADMMGFDEVSRDEANAVFEGLDKQPIQEESTIGEGDAEPSDISKRPLDTGSPPVDAGESTQGTGGVVSTGETAKPSAERPGTGGDGLAEGVTGEGSDGSSRRKGARRNHLPAGTGAEQPEPTGASPGAGISKDTALAEKTAVEPAKQNLRITPETVIVPEGRISRIRANVRALKLLKELGDQDATPEQKNTLLQFSGWGDSPQVFDDKWGYYLQSNTEPSSWDTERLTSYQNWKKSYGDFYKALNPEMGGLLTEEQWDAAKSSTLNAHYTERGVILGMWDLVKQLGFKQGSVLEPSAGTGLFFGLMPGELAGRTRLTGVELEPITGSILKKLYPQADIQVTGFEKSVRTGDNTQDLVVGNFPFGKYKVTDIKHPDYSDWSIHNYFFARSIDSLKPGGILAAITSHFTLDSNDRSIRQYLANKADLVGAIRLPSTAFKGNAGTDVTTDILVFRKKDAVPFTGAQQFLDTLDVEAGKNGPASVNEYFLKHPEMVLGEHSMEGTMYGAKEGEKKYEYTLKPIKGTVLGEAISALAKSFPENIAGEGSVELPAEDQRARAMEGAKQDSYVMQGGKLYQILPDGVMEPPEWAKNPAKVRQAKSTIAVRDHLKGLIDLENQDATEDSTLEARRAELNRLYDEHVKKYGPLSNDRLMEDDPEYPLYTGVEVPKRKAIEYKTSNGETRYRSETTWQKGPIFTKRCNYPRQEPTRADSIEDAVQISLNYRNKIDPAYIANLLGQSLADAKAKILSTDQAYENPETGIIEAADTYLSGFVRKKLNTARLATQERPELERNVKALEAVQPAPLMINNIGFRLGSTFIPPTVIEGFLYDVMGVNAHVTFARAGETSKWYINPTGGEYDAKNKDTWGAGGLPGHSLVETTLNLKNAEVGHMEPNESGKSERWVVDDEPTAAARAKQEDIKEEFKRWLPQQDEHSRAVEKVYNETKNGMTVRKTLLPKFDYLPGASHEIMLRDPQKMVIARNVSEPTLDAHSVGTGKTFIITSTAMEMRRLKTANKPVIVAQNATLSQFVTAFKRLYPNASIWYPSDRDRTDPIRRNRFVSRIATGDWDAVIIPQSFFGMIPNNPEREVAFLRGEMQKIEQAMSARGEDERDPTVKQLEAAKKVMENRIQKLLDKAKDRKDNTIYFEDLGVDALLVDEAHAYKRGFFASKMDNIKGLDRGNASRSTDLLLKIRHIQEKTGGKNIVLATGTPISNTIAEAWTFMRYLRPDMLREMGIEQFDDFASTFGDTVTQQEPTDTGDYEDVTRFAKYTNGHELMTAWKTIADVVLMEDLVRDGVIKDLPKVKDGGTKEIVVERPEIVGKYMRYLKARRAAYDALPPKEKRFQNWQVLVIRDEARKAAIDLRLIDPDFPEVPGAKPQEVVEQVHRIWQATQDERGTQLIFSDRFQGTDPTKYYKNPKKGTVNPFYGGKRFNLFQDMKAKLVKKGIPAEQIAIIHDFDTDVKREVLFQKINSGEIRVVFGTTERLGVGVNVQERAAAVHQIDAVQRPMDHEQRVGRVIRPGNLFGQTLPNGQETRPVESLQYGTKHSLDSLFFEVNRTKQSFINQMLRGDITDRTFDDPNDEVQETFADMAAAFSGNPLLKIKVGVTGELRNLEMREYQHQMDQGRSKEKMISTRDDYIPNADRALEVSKETKAKLDKAFPDGEVKTIQIDDQKYTGENAKKALNEWYRDAYDAMDVAIDGERRKIIEDWFKLSSAETKTKEVRKEFESRVDGLRKSRQKTIQVNGVPTLLHVYSRAGVDTEAFTQKTDQPAPTHSGSWKMDSMLVRHPAESGGYAGEFAGNAHNAGVFESSLKKQIESIAADVERGPRILEKLRREVTELQDAIKRPFGGSLRITELRERLAEIERELAASENKDLKNAKDENFSEFMQRQFAALPLPPKELAIKEATKENPFYIRDQDGFQVAPDAKQIEVKGFDKYTFFARKDADNVWRISEATTGLSSGRGDTRTKALQQAQSNLEKVGLAEFKKKIQEAIAATGASPWTKEGTRRESLKSKGEAGFALNPIQLAVESLKNRLTERQIDPTASEPEVRTILNDAQEQGAKTKAGVYDWFRKLFGQAWMKLRSIIDRLLREESGEVGKSADIGNEEEKPFTGIKIRENESGGMIGQVFAKGELVHETAPFRLERTARGMAKGWARQNKGKDPRISDTVVKDIVKQATVGKTGETTKQIIKRSTEDLSTALDAMQFLHEKLATMEDAAAQGRAYGEAKTRSDIQQNFNFQRQVTNELRKSLIEYAFARLGKDQAGRFMRGIVEALKEPDPTTIKTTAREASEWFKRYAQAAKVMGQMEAYADQLDRKAAMRTIRKTAKQAVVSPSVSVEVKDILRSFINADHAAMTTDALLEMAEQTKQIVKLGRLTERARREMLDKRKQDLVAKFGTEGPTHPINRTPSRIAQPGEELTTFDNVANKIIALRNLRARFQWTYMPINYFLDLLSAREYGKGLSRWFKGPVDLGNQLYLHKAHEMGIINIDGPESKLEKKVKELNIDQKASSKIAAYAEAMQDGGLENLKASGVNPEIIEQLTNHPAEYLTPNEKAFYGWARELMDSYYEPVNKLTHLLYNREMPKVNNYWPRLLDWNKLAEKDVYDRLFTHRHHPSSKTAQGYTISRTKGAMAVKLDAVKVLQQHMDDVAYYLTMQEPVYNLMRAVHSPEFVEHYGDDGQFGTKLWLDAVAKRGGGEQGMKRIEWVDWLMKRANRGMTSFRPFSQLKHISNAGVASALIGPSWYASGIADACTSRWQGFMRQNVPELFVRGGGDMYKQQGMHPAEYAVSQKTDQGNALACFAGAYEKLLHAKGAPIPSEGEIPVDKEALATALIYSHGATASVFAKDLPLMRSQGAWSGNITVDRAISNFQGYLMERYGYFKRDFVALGIKEKDPAQACRAAAGLIIAALLHLGVIVLGGWTIKQASDHLRQAAGIKAKAHKTKPEDEYKKLGGELAVDLLKNTMPLAGNAVAAIKYGSTGIPIIDTTEDLAKQIRYTAQAKNKTRPGALLAGNLATLAGVPGAGQAQSVLKQLLPPNRGTNKADLANAYAATLH